jgi:hypothetical protein
VLESSSRGEEEEEGRGGGGGGEFPPRHMYSPLLRTTRLDLFPSLQRQLAKVPLASLRAGLPSRGATRTDGEGEEVDAVGVGANRAQKARGGPVEVQDVIGVDHSALAPRIIRFRTPTTTTTRVDTLGKASQTPNAVKSPTKHAVGE